MRVLRWFLFPVALAVGAAIGAFLGGLWFLILPSSIAWVASGGTIGFVFVICGSLAVEQPDRSLAGTIGFGLGAIVAIGLGVLPIAAPEIVIDSFPEGIGPVSNALSSVLMLLGCAQGAMLEWRRRN